MNPDFDKKKTKQDKSTAAAADSTRRSGAVSPVAAAAAVITEDLPTTTKKTDGGDVVARYADFEDMELREPLLRGIYGLGYERPSTIQAQAIVPACTGRDMIIQSQSGTGKTATFAIAVLQQLKLEQRDCQALILSPTRELVLQTQRVTTALGDYMNATCHASIGGRNTGEDSRILKRGVQIVCGTPGRVLDNIQKGAFRVDDVRTLVLDEVDVMLQEGFQEQVRAIFRELPSDVQTLVVSATLSPEVLDITNRLLRDPIRIMVPNEEVTLAGIAQFYVECDTDDTKLAVILDVYERMSISKSVIFCNTKRQVMRLQEELHKQDFSVSVIHSDMTQPEREMAMREFAHGATRVLVGTDIICRGIDVQQISLVMNFELPHEIANYIHRIGRGGRFGRKALAINLLGGRRDAARMRDVEKFYCTTVDPLPGDFHTLV